MVIHQLDSSTAKRIAADSIISGMQSAVRELVHNGEANSEVDIFFAALDACPSSVVVRYFPDSLSMAVTDDGEGISEVDLEKLGQPHSKFAPLIYYLLQ